MKLNWRLSLIGALSVAVLLAGGLVFTPAAKAQAGQPAADPALANWTSADPFVPAASQGGAAPAPGKLPDILGITTGMTAPQALALVKAHDPSHAANFLYWTLPQLYGNKPVVGSMNTANTGTEVLLVVVTPPPLAQRVYNIHRTLHVTVAKAALVNQLLQQYGAQPWNPMPNPPPPQNINSWTWLFDETGQPVNPPNQTDKYKMRDCLGLTGQIWGIGGIAWRNITVQSQVQTLPYTQNSVVKANPAFDPTVPHVCDNVVVVSASIGGADPTWIIDVGITDATIQHRAAKALNDALNATVKK